MTTCALQHAAVSSTDAVRTETLRVETARVESPRVEIKTRNYALGYLRAFVVILVIAHHAALGYFPYAPPPAASMLTQPRLWLAFPVVDAHKWAVSTLFVGFNDVFFMSLMFFLSGLFVWPGLERKGASTFLRDRMMRLGIPFVISAAVLAPLAYYASYLQSASHSRPGAFLHLWASLRPWPAGPAWFIWVLLVFDMIAALLFIAAPRWGRTLERMLAPASRSPIAMFATLVAVSALVYIPMALIFTPEAWAAFGPFTVQTSRILHYFAYFAIAIGIGALGLDRGLLSGDGKLARRWYLWVIAAIVLFAAASAVTVIGMTAHAQSSAWIVAMHCGFVLSCATTSFALLASFLRFVRSPIRWLDSVSANSYGIYLFHYAFVTWLQYALLTSSLPPFVKVMTVFLGALGLSWGLASMIRKLPGVGRII